MMTMQTHPLFSDKEIWFLTGSQSMYGDDTLRLIAEQLVPSEPGHLTW